MVSTIPIFYVACFVLLQIICVNFVKSEFTILGHNVTDHVSPQESDRSKRSLIDEMSVMLKIRVRYGNGYEKELNWLKDSQYLANEHLPVIMPLSDLHLNVMNEIGNFSVYYDMSKCSAIVYFEKLNTFHGVIETNYYVRNLPNLFDKQGVYPEVVGEPYIQRRQYPLGHMRPSTVCPSPSDTEAWEDFFGVSNSDTHQDNQRPFESQPGPSSSKKCPRPYSYGKNRKKTTLSRKYSNIKQVRQFKAFQEYYLEILVFVTRDIVQLFKQEYGKDYIEWIVRHHIIYFNAVNMYFRKTSSLHGILYINIAKIIIEDDLIPFTFNKNGVVELPNMFVEVSQYLELHSVQYPRDSFDYVFIHTSLPIWDAAVQVNGMTKHGADLYEARKTNRFYDVVPISVIGFDYYYADVVLAIHEIGRILNIKIDPGTKGLKNLGQCYGIMQRGGPKCIDCLTWSDQSIEQYITFFSENRNRCFLLNKPRSLRPHGAHQFSSPNRQCQCFGFDFPSVFSRSKISPTVHSDGCNQPLRCKKTVHSDSWFHELTVLPFDGTPCTQEKVCWNKQCVHFRYYRRRWGPIENTKL